MFAASLERRQAPFFVVLRTSRNAADVAAEVYDTFTTLELGAATHKKCEMIILGDRTKNMTIVYKPLGIELFMGISQITTIE